MTDDLVAFLRARYDEAAADAAALDAEAWQAETHIGDEYNRGVVVNERETVATCGVEGLDDGEVRARHIARHDPAHVLRDIAAKRAIVDAHDRVWLTTNWRWVNLGSHTEKMPFPICKSCTPDTQFPEQSWPCPTLRHLAAVYDQHPEYQGTWRP